MGRPKLYKEKHFNSSVTKKPNGSVFVHMYRNEWDRTKKVSRTDEKYYVGMLDLSSSRVRVLPTFIENS